MAYISFCVIGFHGRTVSTKIAIPLNCQRVQLNDWFVLILLHDSDYTTDLCLKWIVLDTLICDGLQSLKSETIFAWVVDALLPQTSMLRYRALSCYLAGCPCTAVLWTEQRERRAYQYFHCSGCLLLGMHVFL
jgi:Pyruvate/2-oxoacid:ferredoxin oxidoreductase delta subunit